MNISRALRAVIIGSLIILPVNSAACAEDGIWGLIFGPDPQVDRRHPGPMDDPEIPWVSYRVDNWGRKTWLSDWCLGQRGGSFSQCLESERTAHAREIDAHYGSACTGLDQSGITQCRIEFDQNQVREKEQARLKEAEKELRAHSYEGSADKIRESRKQILGWRRVIAREHRIGEISGYESKSNLYHAGMMIDLLNLQIERDYTEYRQRGGKKRLAEL